MADIRYRPPPSHNLPNSNNTPALWNPQAAVWWSLLLSPAFGAILHLINARAMNHDEQVNDNTIFLIAYGIIIVVAIPLAITHNMNTNFVGIGMTIGWYLVVGKKQVQYVAETFGKDYPHKTWLLPVVLGIVGIIALLFLVVGITALLTGLG